MQRIQYTGSIWQDGVVHPELWRLLLGKDLLIELAASRPPFRVVLGIPHHAAPGVDRIAEAWQNPRTGQHGRPADETTGLMGLALFSTLREKNIPCKLVIAAHASDHDPNKTPGSPYWQSIFEADHTAAPLPGMLFELHGAASHRRHALELSAGRNERARPDLFGRALAYYFDSAHILAVQRQAGSSDARLFTHRQSSGGRLQNPALETLSLSEAGRLGIPALHLEMKSIFRQPDPAFPGLPRPSAAARQLSAALAETFALITQPDEVHISAAGLGLPSTAFLTRPSLEYEQSYLEAMQDVLPHELGDNPDLRVADREEFQALVESARSLILDGLPEHPPEEYLWLIDQGAFIGRVFFLHWLNAVRLQTDGQVDYWIRPSHRRKGYGKLILRLLLERYRQLGLERVLISCLATNLPSQKIIESCGGIFESEIRTSDPFGFPEVRRRYWIDLNGQQAASRDEKTEL